MGVPESVIVRRKEMMRSIRVAALAIVSLWCVAGFAQPQPDLWKPVEAAFGRSGTMQPDGAYKFSMPRGDLHVTAGGVAVKPGFALGSWAAFDKLGPNSMAMGDLVLTEDEVTPVVTKLEQSGIEVTAIHNHLLHESPRVMYVHFHGHGDAAHLAKSLHDALGLTGTPAQGPPPPPNPPALGFDQASVEKAIGRTGKNNGGVLQFTAPRGESITASGKAVPNSMGTATAINFQSTSGGKAAITGDFVMIASEVNPVLAALRAGGIEPTALHSHMLTEQPRLFFMHFWANDDPVKLAGTLKTALEKMNVKK
jgi:hypothetical protein